MSILGLCVFLEAAIISFQATNIGNLESKKMTPKFTLKYIYFAEHCTFNMTSEPQRMMYYLLLNTVK